MGYEYVTGTISASLSRHNSEKDIRHDELWDNFITHLKMIANNPKYKEINLMINANTEGMMGGD